MTQPRAGIGGLVCFDRPTGDLVMWDNRGTVHAATWFDAQRWSGRG